MTFDPEKISGSVMMAAEDAGIPEEEQHAIAKKVSLIVVESLKDKEEISTAEIKSMVLSELDILAPAVADAWREYDQNNL